NPDGQKALPLLEQGLAAAERTLGPEPFTRLAGHFWGVNETRPYMRARLALADCLWSIGRRDESVGHLLDMLRLNPGDKQGIRYLLFARLLELGRDGDFDRLIGEYDEPSAMLLFSKVLRE